MNRHKNIDQEIFHHSFKSRKEIKKALVNLVKRNKAKFIEIYTHISNKKRIKK